MTIKGHITPYTDDPARDADVYYLFKEQQSEQFFTDYQENLKDISLFLSFLHDLDPDDPAWKAIHAQRLGDLEDKAYAYDLMMMMFEQYVEDFTEYSNEFI